MDKSELDRGNNVLVNDMPAGIDKLLTEKQLSGRCIRAQGGYPNLIIFHILLDIIPGLSYSQRIILYIPMDYLLEKDTIGIFRHIGVDCETELMLKKRVLFAVGYTCQCIKGRYNNTDSNLKKPTQKVTVDRDGIRFQGKD